MSINSTKQSWFGVTNPGFPVFWAQELQYTATSSFVALTSEVDSRGCIYLAGQNNVVNQGQIIKLNPQGRVVWNQTYYGVSSFNDIEIGRAHV